MTAVSRRLQLEEIPREFNLASWVIDRHLEEGRGARIALRCAGAKISFAELAGLVNRTGHVLRDAGVRRGDRVLLILSDGVEFVATWYATLKIGGVCAEAYTFLQVKDIAYHLSYSQARVVVADAGTLQRVREAVVATGCEHVILAVGVGPALLGPDEIAFGPATQSAPETLSAAPTLRDEIAIWKFTTGSTGSPKAAVHPHSAPRLSADWYGQRVLGLSEDDLVLPVPKLFFGYARDLTTLFPLAVGGSGIVFPERSTPQRLFELIDEHRPTVLAAVPTMMQQMLDLSDTTSYDLSCLRFCTSAGEALPAALLARWLDTFGVEVLDGLGSSEAYHVYISQYPGQTQPGTLGRLVPGYEARLVDAAGETVADGCKGELWLTGETAALMYWSERPKSLRTFAGTLIHTGDLLSRDPDGFFRYHGRTDNLLKVGGIWVAPEEVEQCLISHPSVAEVAVCGVQRNGLTVTCAYVVAREAAAGDELADELRAHVRSVLSPHKYPREVIFLAALPRTGSGKVDRAAIRAI